MFVLESVRACVHTEYNVNGDDNGNSSPFVYNLHTVVQFITFIILEKWID